MSGGWCADLGCTGESPAARDGSAGQGPGALRGVPARRVGRRWPRGWPSSSRFGGLRLLAVAFFVVVLFAAVLLGPASWGRPLLVVAAVVGLAAFLATLLGGLSSSSSPAGPPPCAGAPLRTATPARRSRASGVGSVGGGRGPLVDPLVQHLPGACPRAARPVEHPEVPAGHDLEAHLRGAGQQRHRPPCTEAIGAIPSVAPREDQHRRGDVRHARSRAAAELDRAVTSALPLSSRW